MTSRETWNLCVATMTRPLIRSIGFLGEPKLEFAYKQLVEDPKSGLAVFGPYDIGLPSQPKSLPYAVVGTTHGIDSFGCWSETIQNPIVTVRPRSKYRPKDIRKEDAK